MGGAGPHLSSSMFGLTKTQSVGKAKGRTQLDHCLLTLGLVHSCIPLPYGLERIETGRLRVFSVWVGVILGVGGGVFINFYNLKTKCSTFVACRVLLRKKKTETFERFTKPYL